ncbi:MAG: transposase [Terriglobales bacterium]|jgi:transposase-like protein
MPRRRRLWRYSDEFRRAALERIANGELQKDVARDLEIDGTMISRWRKGGRRGSKAYSGLEARETAPESEVQQLKQVLATKELELSFFKGALQKVEARRQQQSGEKVSTTKSAK